MSQSMLNYPRFLVTVNGSVLEGVSRVRITQANAYQIASFCLTKGFVPDDGFPASWWAATANKTILVTIELSVDGSTFFPMITGNADSHIYDAIANTIELAGRDLAASMIDTRIVSTYRNLTASEIAEQLSAEHGLQANITPTTTIVGRIYDIDHDETSSGDFSQVSNEWDLLCRLGQAEGIIPYVFGSTLYFNPPSANPPVFSVELTRNANGLLVAGVTGLVLERHMTYARDVIVTVNSWSSRKKTTITATVRTRTNDESIDRALKPSAYSYEIPNLSRAQCLAKAQQLALDISAHERYARVTIPSLTLMDPQTMISVSGTGTDYDMTYFPVTITYEVATECGATTVVDAKFSSPLESYDGDTGQLLGSAQ
jgi:prophage tail gpP-like protein